MATLVLTALGDDQAGLVDALAGTIAAHGGNWTESHMAQLAGKFAGIVVATVPDGRVDELLAAVRPLEAQGLLDITIEVADEAAPAADAIGFTLELLGQDRLGVIAELSHALADLGVSISELWTETREAPMAGGLLFEAKAELLAPADLDEAALIRSLADLSDEFDLELLSPAS